MKTGLFLPLRFTGIYIAFTFTAFITFSSSNHAEGLNLIANGKAYHFDRDTPRNENNWGFGMQYNFKSETRHSSFIAVSSFKDSFGNTSNYTGGGFQRRYYLNKLNVNTHLDLGVMGFVMTRKNYRNGAPFLGAIPFVSIGTENFAVNMTFIPKMDFNESSLVFFQFMFNLGDE